MNAHPVDRARHPFEPCRLPKGNTIPGEWSPTRKLFSRLLATPATSLTVSGCAVIQANGQRDQADHLSGLPTRLARGEISFNSGELLGLAGTMI